MPSANVTRNQLDIFINELQRAVSFSSMNKARGMFFRH